MLLCRRSVSNPLIMRNFGGSASPSQRCVRFRDRMIHKLRISSLSRISRRHIWLAMIQYVLLFLPAMKVAIALFMKTVGPRKCTSNSLLLAHKAEPHQAVSTGSINITPSKNKRGIAKSNCIKVSCRLRVSSIIRIFDQAFRRPSEQMISESVLQVLGMHASTV